MFSFLKLSASLLLVSSEGNVSRQNLLLHSVSLPITIHTFLAFGFTLFTWFSARTFRFCFATFIASMRRPLFTRRLCVRCRGLWLMQAGQQHLPWRHRHYKCCVRMFKRSETSGRIWLGLRVGRAVLLVVPSHGVWALSSLFRRSSDVGRDGASSSPGLLQRHGRLVIWTINGYGRRHDLSVHILPSIVILT